MQRRGAKAREAKEPDDRRTIKTKGFLGGSMPVRPHTGEQVVEWNAPGPLNFIAWHKRKSSHNPLTFP